MALWLRWTLPEIAVQPKLSEPEWGAPSLGTRVVQRDKDRREFQERVQRWNEEDRRRREHFEELSRLRCKLFPTREARALWVYERRREGMTLRAIGAMIGISASVVATLERHAKRLLRPRIYTRWWRGPESRPLDMGGPRDVWLEFGVPADPRMDNMYPVRADG